MEWDGRTEPGRRGVSSLPMMLYAWGATLLTKRAVVEMQVEVEMKHEQL
jgi:hypothetical protein